jgi:hypothetical protein
MAAGISTLEELRSRQAQHAKRRRKEGMSYLEVGHVTRMWPKRADELLQGGSLYWVFAGGIRARQPLLSLSEIRNKEGHRRCRIALHGDIVETRFQPRRAFQGWRYLLAQDAPADLAISAQEEGAPEIRAALQELGLL